MGCTRGMEGGVNMTSISMSGGKGKRQAEQLFSIFPRSPHLGNG